MLKKILIMFGIVFSLGFGYSLNTLEGVNEEKISKVLLQEGVPSGKRGITTLRNFETLYKSLILLRL